MAKSRKLLREAIKTQYLEKLSEVFTNSGETVLRVGSNEIALPVVDSEGNEDYLVITCKVPTGSRDGEAYDGYSMAEDYSLKLKLKAEKAEAAKIAKEKKIAKDKKYRESQAAAKAKREKE